MIAVALLALLRRRSPLSHRVLDVKDLVKPHTSLRSELDLGRKRQKRVLLATAKAAALGVGAILVG
jgi:hypothetical protein